MNNPLYDPGGVFVTEDERKYADGITILGRACGRNNTVNLAKRCIDQGIDGDFVECGVNGGGQIALMAFAESRYGKGNRKIHLYDSFQGFPVAGPDDDLEWKELLGTTEDRIHGHASNKLQSFRWQVEQNMVSWGVNQDLLIYHEGWLQDVLPKELGAGTLPKKIALLRIDVDLYDSTVPVIKYLYPLVESGGYVISDDWGEKEEMAPARLATLRGLEELGEPIPQVTRLIETPGTCWWRKP